MPRRAKINLENSKIRMELSSNVCDDACKVKNLSNRILMKLSKSLDEYSKEELTKIISLVDAQLNNILKANQQIIDVKQIIRQEELEVKE